MIPKSKRISVQTKIMLKEYLLACKKVVYRAAYPKAELVSKITEHPKFKQ